MEHSWKTQLLSRQEVYLSISFIDTLIIPLIKDNCVPHYRPDILPGPEHKYLAKKVSIVMFIVKCIGFSPQPIFILHTILTAQYI